MTSLALSYFRFFANEKKAYQYLLGMGLLGLLFEAPFCRILYHALFPIFGAFYVLLHPSILFFVGMWTIGRSSTEYPSKLYRIMKFFVAVYAGGLLISSALNGAYADLTLRVVLLSFVGLHLGFILALQFSFEDFVIPMRAVKAFFMFVAIAAFAYMILGILGIQFLKNEGRPWPVAFIALRFPGDFPEAANSIYFVIIGNLNKATNKLVLMAVLVAGLFFTRESGKKFYNWLFWILYVATLFMFFSRAALLLSCFVGLAFGAFSFWNARFRSASRKAAICFCVPFLLSISNSYFVNYWLDAATLMARFDMAEDVMEGRERLSNTGKIVGTETNGVQFFSFLSSQMGPGSRAIFGYGVSGYGRRFQEGNIDAGTHNLFLDAWTDGGFIGVFALTMLIFVPLLALVYYKKLRTPLGLIAGLGLFATSAFAFREFSLVYLYTGNICAVLVGYYIGLVCKVINEPQVEG